MRKAHVQLWLETLTDKVKQDAASNALQVRCLQAEVEVVELKEKIGIFERRGSYHVSPTTTSATLAPTSDPIFGWLRRRSAQTSPLVGRGMSGLGLPQELAPPSVGRGLRARSGAGSLNSTPTPSPGTGSGLSALAPGQHLGVPAANAGQAQGPDGAMDVEGEGCIPGASTVTTGASSTMTNQGPAQAGSNIPPQ